MSTKTTKKETRKIIKDNSLSKSKKSAKKPSLGKGLDLIFGEGLDKVINDIESGTIKKEVNFIDINKIIPNPHQPREYFDEEKLSELAESIKGNGLLSPIILKKSGGGLYYIVSGERRYRAHKILKEKKIESIIIDIDDIKMREMALIENIQRENLNPIEEAISIRELIKEKKIKHDELAKILGKSRTYITNSIRVLSLPEYVQNQVLNGKIKFGHIRALVGMDDKVAIDIVKKSISENWTVREIENYIKAYKLRSAKNNLKNEDRKVFRDPEIEYVEEKLINFLGARVSVENKKIIIKYSNVNQLNRILLRMGVIKKDD